MIIINPQARWFGSKMHLESRLGRPGESKGEKAKANRPHQALAQLQRIDLLPFFPSREVTE